MTELEELAKKIRYDLTAAQGKLSELMRGIAELQLPEQGPRQSCPQCGLSFNASPSGAAMLKDHIANVHGDNARLYGKRVNPSRASAGSAAVPPASRSQLPERSR